MTPANEMCSTIDFHGEEATEDSLTEDYERLKSVRNMADGLVHLCRRMQLKHHETATVLTAFSNQLSDVVSDHLSPAARDLSRALDEIDSKRGYGE